MFLRLSNLSSPEALYLPHLTAANFKALGCWHVDSRIIVACQIAFQKLAKLAK